MWFLSHRVDGSNLEEGDHIYSWRIGFSYSHHGIYVGGDKVVHFTQAKDLSCSSFSSSVSNVSPICLDCGFKRGERSGVTMCCLNCFIGNGSLYRYEYGVSKCVFIAEIRGGTCTTAKSDPPEAVIHRAMYLLHDGYEKYGLLTNNCEDFALYCKTGYLVYGLGQTDLGSSGQAASAVGVLEAAILSLPLWFLFQSPVVFGAATAVNYIHNRYVTDIGVRTDKCKVAVKYIAPLVNGLEMLRIFLKRERQLMGSVNQNPLFPIPFHDLSRPTSHAAVATCASRLPRRLCLSHAATPLPPPFLPRLRLPPPTLPPSSYAASRLPPPILSLCFDIENHDNSRLHPPSWLPSPTCQFEYDEDRILEDCGEEEEEQQEEEQEQVP